MTSETPYFALPFVLAMLSHRAGQRALDVIYSGEPRLSSNYQPSDIPYNNNNNFTIAHEDDVTTIQVHTVIYTL